MSSNGSDKKDYKNTLNLPHTEFPMKASLPQREPEQVKLWEDSHTYAKMVRKRKEKPLFVLHDGPPYANGNIHMGHTLNKTLKDIVVKYKNMAGFRTEFIPGWDCHGLPIELGVEKVLREKKIEKSSLSKVDLRKKCKEFANSWIDKQREQFKRLGVFGDWDNPYLTMSDEYVANIIRELGRISATGNLYKGNKPVYWCPSCATALAEAEIEYHDHKSPSIYVKFFFQNTSAKKIAALSSASKPIATVIWTTTPWTLPANLAVALHPDFEYAAIETDKDILIVAEGLRERFLQETGLSGNKIATIKSKDLENLKVEHPFMKRTSLVILGDHVTLEAGTGIVHTAPGHGMEDYIVGLKYKLEPFAPIDAYGRFTDEVPQYKGVKTSDANPKIIESLTQSGHLIKVTEISHSYPHCWRCNKPVLFRATPQWFISMEKTGLRKHCIEQIHKVEWIPEWGINRILGMIENRPDWCISRQRIWGVPITVFYCEKCDEPVATQDSFEFVAALVEKHGPNIWYEWEPERLIKPETRCKCGETKAFRKETDILDVWFDSGVSHAAVLTSQKNFGKVKWPADLYLEGSDQHRGWFQTSLLTAVQARGQAPFKRVLTHGFVNDKDGYKMSKSKGNVADPLEFCQKYGAEILRLWVVLEDYRNDLRFSSETIDRISESYRKIRNTFRYILSNLYDFDPEKMIPYDQDFCDLDHWALHKTGLFLDRLQHAYDSYEFHIAYHALVNFCVVDLSAVYFDVLKDRLYTSKKDSKQRRSSQAALYQIGSALASGLAPILSFTSEEVWKFLKQEGSVFESDFPVWKSSSIRESAYNSVEKVIEIREQVNKALEEARSHKLIGHSLEAKITITASQARIEQLKSVRENLARLFIVSQVEYDASAADAFIVNVSKADGEKCARCWVYSTHVGKGHPELCERCVEAI
ncbi:MAG: isoleucine--tRNA ligase [Bacteriovoracia bacterium]